MIKEVCSRFKVCQILIQRKPFCRERVSKCRCVKKNTVNIYILLRLWTDKRIVRKLIEIMSKFFTKTRKGNYHWKHQFGHDNSIQCKALWQIYRDRTQSQKKKTTFNESTLQFS